MIFNVSQFDFDPSDNGFSAEASELGIGSFPPEIILADRAGSAILALAHEHTHRDSDGDVTFVTYRAGSFSAVIFND